MIITEIVSAAAVRWRVPFRCEAPSRDVKERRDLARLRRANIVRTRRESQTIYYSIDDTDVLRILRLLGHIYTDDPVMQRTRH